jgi:hypothetical protein
VRGLAAAAAAAVMIVVACGSDRREEPRPAATQSGPLLDDKRLEQLIVSLNEKDNPFEPILRGDASATPEQLVGKIDEMNAFARKHGFRDHDDYLQVWLRVTLVAMNDVASELDELAVQAATQIEARLRDPALTEAQRSELTRKLAEARAEIGREDGMPKVDPKELELIRSRGGELSAALARWR